MMKHIYLDNSVIQELCINPQAWNQLYDFFLSSIGRSYMSIKSYYAFLEHIGFTLSDLNVPASLRVCEWTEEDLKCFSDDRVSLLDDKLEELVKNIIEHVRNQMVMLKQHICDLWQRKRVHSWEGIYQLREDLFGFAIELVESDYSLFSRDITPLLVWDIFSTIQSKKIALTYIRQRQLGYWWQQWKNGRLLPFGKIIDDTAKFYRMNFTAPFGNLKDMMDSELVTYAIMGKRVDGAHHRVTCLTFDPPESVDERLVLALGSVKNIQLSLNVDLGCMTGKVYCLAKSDGVISVTHCHEPQLSIQL